MDQNQPERGDGTLAQAKFQKSQIERMDCVENASLAPPFGAYMNSLVLNPLSRLRFTLINHVHI